jgi:hypothetical protein
MGMPKITQGSAGASAFQQAVESELRLRYANTVPVEVLAQYIVVMFVHGNSLQEVTDSLEAFLGRENSPAFAKW